MEISDRTLRNIAAYIFIVAALFLTLAAIEAFVGRLNFWLSIAVIVVASFVYTGILRRFGYLRR